MSAPLIETWLDGLLPDLPADREQWRLLVGAASIDPFNLLSTPIGTECAGAVQFEPDGATDAVDRPSALERVSEAEVGLIGGLETLIVQRFDRARPVSGIAALERIHQEDMCQAFGLPAALRFQRDGGPSTQDIAGLLRSHSSNVAADTIALFKRLVYCWVIVANDAHGKNHALLHLPGGACRLAPLYDVASWLPYIDVPARDVHLAMALGGGYDVGVGARTDDWRAMAREIGADPEWAVAEVIRIAREAPAHLLAEIDELPPAVRSSGAPTRLLDAVARRSVDIVDATLG
ncbi:HipA domain-containing protein [Candidatus Poriferisodalis sp.]|uniref:HipA domain-containing protein n=1 Tax=Candidatus Poriferisodalis sp. TaxID=3101277 RepID=UPI003D0EAAA0